MGLIAKMDTNAAKLVDIILAVQIQRNAQVMDYIAMPNFQNSQVI